MTGGRIPLFLVGRNLRTRWIRTLLTTVGIVVGVGAMVAVQTTNDSTIQAINRFFDEASGQSDLVIEAAATGETFAADVLSQVQRDPDVAAAAPVLVGITILADEANTWENTFGIGGQTIPGTSFWLMGRDPTADATIHTFRLVAGRLLQPAERGYSVVLVDAYAREHELEVGDDLAILSPAAGVARLRVVGLIAKEGLGIANEGALGITHVEVVQELFNQAGQLSQVEVRLDPAVAAERTALDAARRRLSQRLGRGLRVQPPAARGEAVSDSLDTYQRGLDFFGVVSLFVGSFLIYNAFAMTVVERTREIGMFRAIGMTRGQIRRLVLAEATGLGVLGAALGVGFGLLLARVLIRSVSGFSGQAIEQVSASAGSVAAALLVGMAVTLAAALVPSWQASRVSPLQALRAAGSSDGRRWQLRGLRFGPLTVTVAILVVYYVPLRAEVVFYVGSNAIFLLLLGATLCIPLVTPFLERALRPAVLWLFGPAGRLGSQNINRAVGRTTLTVAALMVGISMVVGISGMTGSFEQDILDWVDSALGGDLFVRSPLEMRAEMEGRLLALPGVTAVTRSRLVASRLLRPNGEDEYAVFVAIDPATYLDVRGVRVQQGPAPAELLREMAAGDAIWVGADVANQLQLAVGDQVVLETRRGRRPFRVAAIVIDFAGGETTTITGSWGDLRRYFGLTDVSTFAVRLAPGASLSTVSAQIEQVIGRGQSLSVESRSQFEARIRDLSTQAFQLFDALALIGLVVGGLGVINTMLMNVLERTRELGSLRSLGMTRRQVQRMILAEAATIGVMGGLSGAAAGIVLTDVFLVGLRSLGGFVLTPRVPYLSLLLSFGGALLLAVGASLYPAWRAGQVNIIQAIKHE